VTCYQQVLATRPDSHDAWVGMARAYEKLGRFEDGVRCCERAVSDRPNHWAAHAELGRLRIRQGRFEEALEPWRKVVAMMPDSYLGYLNVGTAYFSLGRNEEALLWTHRSIDLHPSGRAYSNLGAILFYLARYEEAAIAFRKATALRPADAITWGNLGSACALVPGLAAEAEAALDHAIGLVRERLSRNPNQAEDWIALGGWLGNRGRHDEAVAAADRARQLCPDDVTLLARTGSIHYQAGDRSASLTIFAEAARRGFELHLLLRDPYLAGLRDDPDFRHLIEEAARPQGRDESKSEPTSSGGKAP
jgi:tetratricopeptide (TPR) repeat protein